MSVQAVCDNLKGRSKKQVKELYLNMYNFLLANVDTDSLSIASPDGELISKEDRKLLLDELNSLFPSRIQWDDDGFSYLLY